MHHTRRRTRALAALATECGTSRRTNGISGACSAMACSRTDVR